MKPFVHAILSKLGFNQNMAREIIYRTSTYGGFQIAHLHLEQVFLAVKHLLGHLQEMAITGEQLMIGLSKA
eukprot:6975577-Ditylum_brightwellii.AAC.1